jgi:hypothetical protein
MTLQETRWGEPDAIYDVEFPTPETWPGEDLDLNRFQRLSDDERMRIIIRVLCGLVAIDEQPGPEPARAALPVTITPDEAPVLPVAPTPGPARSLPLLGLEPEHNTRTRPKGWNTALLPFIGQERPY